MRDRRGSVMGAAIALTRRVWRYAAFLMEDLGGVIADAAAGARARKRRRAPRK